MNAYPSFPQFVGTLPTIRSGVLKRVARNGSVRVRILAPPKKDWTVVHSLLIQADRDTLVAFYEANTGLEINFTAVEDGVLRVMFFDPDKPLQTEASEGALYKATAYLLEA